MLSPEWEGATAGAVGPSWWLPAGDRWPGEPPCFGSETPQAKPLAVWAQKSCVKCRGAADRLPCWRPSQTHEGTRQRAGGSPLAAAELLLNALLRESRGTGFRHHPLGLVGASSLPEDSSSPPRQAV